MAKPAVVAVNTGITLPYKSSRRQKHGTLSTYHEFVNLLMETYAAVGVITYTNSGFLRFVRPANKSLTKYSKTYCNNPLWCNAIHHEYVLKAIFMKRLPNKSNTEFVLAGTQRRTRSSVTLRDSWRYRKICKKDCSICTKQSRMNKWTTDEVARIDEVTAGRLHSSPKWAMFQRPPLPDHVSGSRSTSVLPSICWHWLHSLFPFALSGLCRKCPLLPSVP